MKISIRQAKITNITHVARVDIDSWQAIYWGLIADIYLDDLSLEEKVTQWQKYLQENIKFG